MNRRSFIQSKIAGTAIIASSGLVCKASAENPPSVSKDTDLLDVDVLVVGGGSAGHVAAIQAGRLGAKTVLLERNSQLGAPPQQAGFAFLVSSMHGANRSLLASVGNWWLNL